MSAALHLAGPEDLGALLPMVTACHDYEDIESDDARREAALAPLLEGSPLGCVYLVGPRRAPVGYIVITFGWSVEFGGMEGFIDEFFIRENVRGRGMGSEVLLKLIPQLESAGLMALHLEASQDRPRLQKLYARAGFRLRDGYALMTRTRKA
ncbi:GNAT family N-acetyltransferase [Ovoidimarina sediminis]|uniref:GNAT family N-acetyltransferase n=1 Tax=Ovoidimarina sediminis TaxID=3079856 RepID=UPI00290652DC|nr:GNAT family N-acetyltransferase [Rhodophyticola sp. MJ-SS7]MDU8945668.1 GNAT family N-acetyltransferase [Rhodophyticola sp. MJ-SS7]